MCDNPFTSNSIRSLNAISHLGRLFSTLTFTCDFFIPHLLYNAGIVSLHSIIPYMKVKRNRRRKTRRKGVVALFGRCSRRAPLQKVNLLLLFVQFMTFSQTKRSKAVIRFRANAIVCKLGFSIRKGINEKLYDMQSVHGTNLNIFFIYLN